MTLMIVVGGLGSGKTCLLTYLALKHCERGGQIWANYSISAENYHYLRPEDLMRLGRGDMANIDEAYNWLEARTSNKGTNRYLSYIVFQSRKRDLSINLTAQMISSIDVRFRTMADYLAIAQKKSNRFSYTLLIATGKGFKERHFSIPFSVAEEQIWPYYDTFEIIDPLDRELSDLAMSDQSVLLPEADKIVDRMLQLGKAKSWTKGAVSDFCLENGHPKSYIDLLYNRIRRREVG